MHQVQQQKQCKNFLFAVGEQKIQVMLPLRTTMLFEKRVSPSTSVIVHLYVPGCDTYSTGLLTPTGPLMLSQLYCTPLEWLETMQYKGMTSSSPMAFILSLWCTTDIVPAANCHVGMHLHHYCSNINILTTFFTSIHLEPICVLQKSFPIYRVKNKSNLILQWTTSISNNIL